MSRTFYVSLYRMWMLRERRFSTRFGASEEKQIPSDDQLGLWQVRATSPAEAIGTVAEYLLKGQPDHMLVERIFISTPDRQVVER